MKIFLGILIIVVLIQWMRGETFTKDKDIDGLADYSFKLYKLQYNPTVNSVFSPYSFRVLLSVLYQSTYGSTEELFKSKLDFGDKHETLEAQQLNLNRIFDSINVKIANKIYLKEELKLNSAFNRIVDEYKSEVELVDFRQSTQAANKMNEWVEQKTNGLIKDLVNTADVTSNTVMFLINALYFKAEWQKEFSSKFESTFNNIDGTITKTNFVTKKTDYFVSNDNILKTDVIEIPYKSDSNFVLWVLLPHIDSTLTFTVEHLDVNSFKRIKSDLQNVSTKLELPEFKISTEINGKDLFTKFGLGDIFFEFNSQILDGNGSIAVSHIKQKATITVDKHGTEAAAASFIDIATRHMLIPTIEPVFIPFIVDRPFMYAVLTADEKEPIFIGHYASAKL